MRAIHQQGQGLERIKFKNPQGADLGILLTESEVRASARCCQID